MTSAARDLLEEAKKLPPDERQTLAEVLCGTSAAQEIIEEAKKLPPDERQALAEALWDSLESEPTSLSPEWTAEVSSRIAQLERGEVKAVPWSEVEATIRRTLGR
jgi:putative addiction module component (TIGR02574 family)